MTAPQGVNYDDLDDLVVRLELGADPSELHGSLCGFLSGGGRFGAKGVLETLHLEQGLAAGPRDLATLKRLREESETALDDAELSFQPLLPDDDAAMSERADSLVEWCRGFLGGIGLAGSAAHAELSDEAREVLKDLATIASSQLDTGDDEEDEASYVEVLEFVRVGVLLLHAELSSLDKPASDTLH